MTYNLSHRRPRPSRAQGYRGGTFFFSSRRRHTTSKRDWSSDVCSSDLDFKDPAASPLMRELWQTGTPAVRALVGRLALACRRPIAETRSEERRVGKEC